VAATRFRFSGLGLREGFVDLDRLFGFSRLHEVDVDVARLGAVARDDLEFTVARRAPVDGDPDGAFRLGLDVVVIRVETRQTGERVVEVEVDVDRFAVVDQQDVEGPVGLDTGRHVQRVEGLAVEVDGQRVWHDTVLPA